MSGTACRAVGFSFSPSNIPSPASSHTWISCAPLKVFITSFFLGVTSHSFQGSFFLENHQQPLGNGDQFLKRTMAEKNGEKKSTPSILEIDPRKAEKAHNRPSREPVACLTSRSTSRVKSRSEPPSEAPKAQSHSRARGKGYAPAIQTVPLSWIQTAGAGWGLKMGNTEHKVNSQKGVP